MLYKNLPDKELRHVMRWRWVLDYVAAYETLLVNRNVGDFKAIYRARRDFKRWKKDFKADRDELQRSRVMPVVAERRPISRFSELPR